MSVTGPVTVVGRDRELSQVDRWAARLAEEPSALVLSGGAGVGKTTLLGVAISASNKVGAQVLTARPVQAELTLGFAALVDLLDPVAHDLLPRLPGPLARALASALLRGEADADVDLHAVGRGLTEALRLLAAQTPVVLAIDDAQWLDAPSSRAITFAMRRLEGKVGLIVTHRDDDDGDGDPLGLAWGSDERITRVVVRPLSADATQRLLRLAGSDLPKRSLLRVHAESGGNPFYSLELARAASQPGLPPALRSVVSHRLNGLPGIGRPVVELIAVLGPMDVDQFSQFIGDAEVALDAAVDAGLLVVRSGQASFVHPLLAAGAYESISSGRRRSLHRRAAELVHGVEQQARHVALATTGRDRDAATLLEQAALAARARCAPESAAELASHARRLTPAADVDDLHRRVLLQADSLYLAGADHEASRLVEDLLASGVRGVSRARALIHRVQHDEEPYVAVARLEEAVQEATGDDVVKARALTTLAWMRGLWAGDLDIAVDEAETALLLAETTADTAVITTALTTAAVVHACLGDPQAEVYFRRAVDSADGIEWIAGDRSPLVAYAHQRFWRAHWVEASELLAREREDALRNGEDSRLERLNIFRADLAIRRGHWGEADRLLEDALAWAPPGYWRTRALLWRALLRARRGESRALDDIVEAAGSPALTTDPLLVATAAMVNGLVALVEGRIQDAVVNLQPLCDVGEQKRPRELAILLVEPDAIEALISAGDLCAARELTDSLELRAEASRHPVGLPAAARCRGLLALAVDDIDSALLHLDQARQTFAQQGMPYELARTLLVEGMALRRAGRRTHAGDTLESAQQLFEELKAERWVERCRQELRRARPRPRHGGLTEAETRVASLVVAGRTNREVAAGLFTSVATVEAHLTRIYRKVNVRSRTELAHAVAGGSVTLTNSSLMEPRSDLPR